jgi:hypothetical protein
MRVRRCGGFHLPLAELDLDRQRLAGRGGHIKEHRRGGQLLGHEGLAAGLGTFAINLQMRGTKGSG